MYICMLWGALWAQKTGYDSLFIFLNKNNVQRQLVWESWGYPLATIGRHPWVPSSTLLPAVWKEMLWLLNFQSAMVTCGDLPIVVQQGLRSFCVQRTKLRGTWGFQILCLSPILAQHTHCLDTGFFIGSTWLIIGLPFPSMGQTKRRFCRAAYNEWGSPSWPFTQ